MATPSKMNRITFHQQFAKVLPGATLQEFEIYCGLCFEAARDNNWYIGDLALASERAFPAHHEQVWVPEMSVDLIARCKAVAQAYPPEDRNPLASWSIHMHYAKQPNRVALVQQAVEKGLNTDQVRSTSAKEASEAAASSAATSDVLIGKYDTIPEDPKSKTSEESVETDSSEVIEEVSSEEATEPAKPESKPIPEIDPKRWLVCVDVNFFIHKNFHAGQGFETATNFVSWLDDLVVVLKSYGLTDMVCCLDSPTNHRKTLTEGWEHGYKPRPPKAQELSDQIALAPKLLKERNYTCVMIDDMEADDVMASYAIRFGGKVTLLTGDKDMRQCLSSKCNLLSGVSYDVHPDTGKRVAKLNWITTASHIDEGITYSSSVVSGITPEQWPHFQALAGDSSDGIKGVKGIGAKHAMELIKEYKTVFAVVKAAMSGSITIVSKLLCDSIIAFEPFAATTLLLTTMRTDLDVPFTTRMAREEMPESGKRMNS